MVGPHLGNSEAHMQRSLMTRYTLCLGSASSVSWKSVFTFLFVDGDVDEVYSRSRWFLVVVSSASVRIIVLVRQVQFFRCSHVCTGPSLSAGGFS